VGAAVLLVLAGVLVTAAIWQLRGASARVETPPIPARLK
jgi:hypothetical protein